MPVHVAVHLFPNRGLGNAKTQTLFRFPVRPESDAIVRNRYCMKELSVNQSDGYASAAAEARLLPIAA